MKLRLSLTVALLTVLELAILDVVPWSLFKRFYSLNGTVAFICVGLVALLLIKLFDVRTQRYFRLPRISPVSLTAIGFAGALAAPAVFHMDNEAKSIGVTIFGIVHLLAIGFGEEFFSRGFLFGVLEKYGTKSAFFYSSLIFGLMHLNRYRGDNWDPWSAYWHVMSAFSFGLYACALMIATRSIWVSILFHALSDWFIVFQKTQPEEGAVDNSGVGIWEGLTSPASQVLIYGGLACMILWLNRGVRLSYGVRRLLTRFKLINNAE